MCIGGKVPEKYRLKNIRENIDMSNFDNCTVQRGSSVQLDYDVVEPGSTLRYVLCLFLGICNYAIMNMCKHIMTISDKYT